jgi:hypothetical protein
MLSKKIYRYILVLLVLLFAAGYYAYHEYNRKPVNTAELPPMYELSAPDLIYGFQSGESVANQKYLGKVLSVSGMIKSFDKDSAGLYTLILGDTTSLSSVRCSINVRMADDSLLYRIGAKVLIKGFCAGYTSDNMGLGADVILNRCLYIKSFKP